MLVLSRRDGEQIVVGDDIVISVLSIGGGRVRVGIEAPLDVPVRRAELAAMPNQRRVSHRWEQVQPAELPGLAVAAS